MTRRLVLAAFYLALSGGTPIASAFAGEGNRGLELAADSARAAVSEADPAASAVHSGKILDGGTFPAEALPVPAVPGVKELPEYSPAGTSRVEGALPPAPAARKKPGRLKALGLALWSPIETPVAMMFAIGIWGASIGYALVPVRGLRGVGVTAGSAVGAVTGLVAGAVLGLVGFIPKVVRALARGR